MVGVAQLVELLVVVQAVVGSSPIAHPSRSACKGGCFRQDALVPVGHCPGGRGFEPPQGLLDKGSNDVAGEQIVEREVFLRLSEQIGAELSAKNVSEREVLGDFAASRSRR